MMNRRQKQTKTAGGNEMDAVRNYFNTEGFGRWQKIYGDKDDVSKVKDSHHMTHGISL